MTSTGNGWQSAGRILAGAMSCALLGFLIEPFGFWSGPHGGAGFRFPMIGPAVGAVIGMLIGLTCGTVEIRGLTKRLVIGLLSGIVIGLLTGILVFAPLMTALHPESASYAGKVFAAALRIGILWGLLIGAAGGTLTGCVLHVRQKARSDEPAAR